VSAWAGIRFEEPGRAVGWSALLDGVVEHVQIAAGAPMAEEDQGDEPLVHRRGRYLRPGGGR
jgi:hypothetical protein